MGEIASYLIMQGGLVVLTSAVLAFTNIFDESRRKKAESKKLKLSSTPIPGNHTSHPLIARLREQLESAQNWEYASRLSTRQAWLLVLLVYHGMSYAIFLFVDISNILWGLDSNILWGLDLPDIARVVLIIPIVALLCISGSIVRRVLTVNKSVNDYAKQVDNLVRQAEYANAMGSQP